MKFNKQEITGRTKITLIISGAAMLAGDPFSKGVSAMIINRLPYARKEEEAKNKTKKGTDM